MTFDQDNLDLAIDVAGLGRWEYDPDTGETTLDERCLALLGLAPDQAGSMDNILKVVYPEDRRMVLETLSEFNRDSDVFKLLFRVLHADGTCVWIRSLGRRVSEEGLKRMLGVTMDATAEQTLLMQRELHLAEMNHRVKNLFALVSVMVSNAKRESETREDIVENLQGRISALSRAHSLMLGPETAQPVTLRGLFEQILAPTIGGQVIRLSGEDIRVPSKFMTPLVLIVHEWMTNSAKYGTLRDGNGELYVNWHRVGATVTIHWCEKVDEYQGDQKGGFGTRLLRASVTQLGAQKTRSHSDGWLRIEMSLQLPSTGS